MTTAGNGIGRRWLRISLASAPICSLADAAMHLRPWIGKCRKRKEPEDDTSRRSIEGVKAHAKAVARDRRRGLHRLALARRVAGRRPDGGGAGLFSFRPPPQLRRSACAGGA